MMFKLHEKCTCYRSAATNDGGNGVLIVDLLCVLRGLKTVYVHRWTEDPDLDMSIVRTQFDAFVDGRETTAHKGGLLEVAGILDA